MDENFNEIWEEKQTIPCDTLLLSIGLIPENDCPRTPAWNWTAKRGAVVTEDMQTKCPAFLLRNVLHVHDIVDFVTAESRVAGANAARYALGHREEKEYYETVAGEGVSYVVPQKIHAHRKEASKLSFRTDNVYHRRRILVKSKDRIIAKKMMPVMVPSEMIILPLSEEQMNQIDGDVVVELEAK